MSERPDTQAATELPPADLNEVAAILFPEADAIEPLAGRPYLARVRQHDEWWKLRRWPEGVPQARVEFVHRTMERVRSENVSLVPAIARSAGGSTAILHKGQVYDAQSWLPGHHAEGGAEALVPNGRWAPLPAVVPDPLLVGVMQSVARVHFAAPAEVDPTQAGSPMLDLMAAVGQAWRAQRGVLRPIATQTPAVRRWLATGERALPAAEAALAAAAGEASLAKTVCHFGLWPDHVLVSEPGSGDAVSGLIGWEHCNVGSPLIDIVQAVSRFRGWSAATVEIAIAGYSDILPLRPEDRRLLPAVAALDLVATSGQMLIFAYGGRPGSSRPPTALREAARTLLDSLDVATNALAAIADKPRERRGDARRGRSHRPRPKPPKPRPRGPQKKR